MAAFIQFLHPWIILLIIPLFPILIYVIGKTFVDFKDYREKIAFNKNKRLDKTIMILTRTIIIGLLFIALASPYKITTIERKGDPTINILVDGTESFGLFDSSFVNSLKEKISPKIPVSVRSLASGNTSAIGTGLRNNMQGNDNILLVTDGYNNHGLDFGDALLFAKDMHSSVSAV